MTTDNFTELTSEVAQSEVSDADRTARRPRSLWVAGVVLFALAVVFYYLISRRIWGGNSDVATPILQGQAMAQGHLTLNGWNFIHDSFWTVDVLFYTVGYFFVGIDPQLMFIIPAIVAATIVAVGIRLANDRGEGQKLWVSAIAVVALLGLPTQGWTFLFISIYGHPVTILYALLAFLMLRTPGSTWRWLAAIVLLALGLLGDLQILPLAVGPVFGAGIVAMLRTRTLRAGLPLIGAAAAAPVLAYAVRQLAVLIGTYGIAESNPTATSDQMRSNLANLPEYLGWAFGAGTGLSSTVGSTTEHDGLLASLLQDGEIRVVAAAIVVLAVIVAVLRTTFQALRGSNRSEPTLRPWVVDDMLAIACVGDVVFFAVATLDDEPAYTRYVASFVVFGSILAARHLGVLTTASFGVRLRVPLVTIGATLVIIFGAASVTALSNPEQPFTNQATTDFIAEKGLHRGVGMFWDANQSTVASGGDVVIRPVVGTPAGLIPREQLARDTWYREPFEFVLCQTDTKMAFEGVSCALAISQFGEPERRYRIGEQELLVWDQPVEIRP